MAIVDWSKIVLLALLVLVVSTTAAQSDRKDRVYRLGFLAFGSRPVGSEVKSPLVTFRQVLRERGYVEGKNLILDERWAEARLSRLPALVAELVQLKPDIIVASGASAVRAAMRETKVIPIVIAGASDPVAEGLVETISRPGGNVTGIAALPGRLEGKRLEFLLQVIPGATHVAVILDSTSRLDSTPLEEAAHTMGLSLLFSAETESEEEFRDTFAQIVRDGADGLYAPETPINVHQRRLIVELALEHRLPAIYASREYVEAGGFMSYGPNFSELFGRAAIYTDKILQGANPGELPIEQPMHLELVLNKKVAKHLGLSFPTAILMLADEVIQ